MSKIPEARRLFQLAMVDLRKGMRKLTAAERLLTRSTPVRRAASKSARLTPELAKTIRHYARQHPTMPFQKIGVHFNVNGGRVSEAVRHLR